MGQELVTKRVDLKKTATLGLGNDFYEECQVPQEENSITKGGLLTNAFRDIQECFIIMIK